MCFAHKGQMKQENDRWVVQRSLSCSHEQWLVTEEISMADMRMRFRWRVAGLQLRHLTALRVELLLLLQGETVPMVRRADSSLGGCFLHVWLNPRHTQAKLEGQHVPTWKSLRFSQRNWRERRNRASLMKSLRPCDPDKLRKMEKEQSAHNVHAGSAALPRQPNTSANYSDSCRVCDIKPFMSDHNELSGNLHLQKAFVWMDNMFSHLTTTLLWCMSPILANNLTTSSFPLYFSFHFGSLFFLFCFSFP